jgi:hypothetical protein
MLCETCGVSCENCHKVSCPDHIHETGSGRVLCEACYNDRKKKRKQAKAAHAKKGEGEEVDTSLQGLEEEIEGNVGDEALTLSAREPLQPWQWSLYIAIGGVAVALLMLIVPALRRIPTGGENFIPTSYIVLIIPLLGVVWAIVGLVKEDYYRDRPKCLYGFGVSIVAAILAFLVIWIDPAMQVDPAEEQGGFRQDMTPEELQQWRENTLNRYQQ